MGQNSNNMLTIKHISEPVDEIVNYIDNRRKGVVKSLRTKWKKFNSTTMGGIEPNVIITVAGISGSGKSAFVNTLETDLFDLNPDGNFVVLSFSFEMLSSRQVGRKLSYKLSKTTKELYSGLLSDDPKSGLKDSEFNRILEVSEAIKKYDIYYVDTPGTVEDIYETIIRFMNMPEIKGKWVIVTLDHVLLTKGNMSDKERETIYNIQKMFIEVKKIKKTSIIQISQMNRDIESSERITNQSLHFPLRRDLFGSDSIFQASDYVIVLHRPETLGIRAYGIHNWPVKDMLYMHFLKCREGEPKILSFRNDLKYNNIEEVDPMDLLEPKAQLQIS